MYIYNRQNNTIMQYQQESNQLPLAQAYVVNQPYVGIVSPYEGLKRGSLFPNLYMPYKLPYYNKY